MKYYIYSSRCNDNQLLLVKFYNIWKELYHIKRNVAFRNKCIEQIENKWKLFEKLPHTNIENHFIVTKNIFM